MFFININYRKGTEIGMQINIRQTIFVRRNTRKTIVVETYNMSVRERKTVKKFMTDITINFIMTKRPER